jgi:hypothetical protein
VSGAGCDPKAGRPTEARDAPGRLAAIDSRLARRALKRPEKAHATVWADLAHRTASYRNQKPRNLRFAGLSAMARPGTPRFSELAQKFSNKPKSLLGSRVSRHGMGGPGSPLFTTFSVAIGYPTRREYPMPIKGRPPSESDGQASARPHSSVLTERRGAAGSPPKQERPRRQSRSGRHATRPQQQRARHLLRRLQSGGNSSALLRAAAEATTLRCMKTSSPVLGWCS